MRGAARVVDGMGRVDDGLLAAGLTCWSLLNFLAMRRVFCRIIPSARVGRLGKNSRSHGRCAWHGSCELFVHKIQNEGDIMDLRRRLVGSLSLLLAALLAVTALVQFYSLRADVAAEVKASSHLVTVLLTAGRLAP